MDQKKFYQVWGADIKPEPSTYLSTDYINSHLSKAKVNGVSRFTAEPDYDKFVVQKKLENGGLVAGYKTKYQLGNIEYEGGSEFMTLSSNADDIYKRALNSENPAVSLANDLSMDDSSKFVNGVVRCDVSSSELDKLNLRMPCGNEPGTYKMDWIPGGYTLDGSYECVIDKFSLDGSTAKVEKVF